MIKKKVGEYFGLSMEGVNTSLYMANMNEGGKITARSLLDLMTILIDEIDDLQNKEPELSNYEILNPSKKK